MLHWETIYITKQFQTYNIRKNDRIVVNLNNNWMDKHVKNQEESIVEGIKLILTWEIF